MLNEIKQDLHPRRLLTIVMAGLVIGAIDLPQIISLSALVYSGGLAQYAAVGIGFGLCGAIIMQLTMSFFSSSGGVLGGPQDSPAAVLSLVAASISAGMVAAADEARFATALAAVIIASFGIGILFVLVGRFNLHRFIRFIPFPVIGGFIAGTGLLLVEGSIGIMTDMSPGVDNLQLFWQPVTVARWLPGALLGLALLFATRRSGHFLITPGLLTLSVGGFYGYAWAAGLSIAAIRADGWLLGPFPAGALWKPLDPALLNLVDWKILAAQTGNMLTVGLLSVVACLLNLSALELILKNDLDMRREMTVIGISNAVGSLAGSFAGYHYLGLSGLAVRMKAKSRLVGLAAALVLLVILLFGGTLLALVPKFMVGGLLFFLGMSFLLEWAVDTWSRLPRTEYALVLVILVVVAWVGFLEGVGVGILASAIIFVVNYSRIDAVKDTLTRATFRSNVERTPEQQQLLHNLGGQVYILRLNGFLFFGTAQALLARVRDRFSRAAEEKPRYLILDFRRVSALDSSAVLSFVRIHQLTLANDAQLLFTAVNADIQHKLERGGLGVDANLHFHICADLDRGVEWCENRILADNPSSLIMRSTGLETQLRKTFPTRDMNRFREYLVREELEAGSVLIRQGDPPDALFFIEAGRVSAQLEMAQGQVLRLRELGAGMAVGEIGMYLKETRTATVVAVEKSVTHRLTIQALHKMEKDDPTLALHLHQWMAASLAYRLADTNRTITALLD